MLLRPKLKTKRKRELGGRVREWLCVCEREIERKYGMGEGREEVRKSRGGRESIGWEIEEV